MHQWMYDDDQYYTRTARKYLTYSNPNQTARWSDDIAALKSGLVIAAILNRTLILPKFTCGETNCPLNSLLSVKRFNKMFQYREHSFLSHPLVPKIVKSSTFGPVLIASHLNMADSLKFQNQTVISFQPVTLENGMDDKEILSHFGNISQSVLVFHSLYGAFRRFQSEKADQEWQRKFNYGIVASIYRQR